MKRSSMSMKLVLEVFYFGYGILICAVMINVLGTYLGMNSWYDLLGSMTFFELSLVNMFWLIVAYPFLLGMAIYVLNTYKTKIIK